MFYLDISLLLELIWLHNEWGTAFVLFFFNLQQKKLDQEKKKIR